MNCITPAVIETEILKHLPRPKRELYGREESRGASGAAEGSGGTGLFDGVGGVLFAYGRGYRFERAAGRLTEIRC